MGRKRTFDVPDVVRVATGIFITHGYEGTSIDQLVEGTGVHRASLYSTFGSKHGLFLACLQAHGDLDDEQLQDLVLVALLERAPRDEAVRDRVLAIVAELDADDLPGLLGRRLLERATITNHRKGIS